MRAEQASRARVIRLPSRDGPFDWFVCVIDNCLSIVDDHDTSLTRTPVRWFGNSSRPATGYDYDTFAADLKALVDTLVSDQAFQSSWNIAATASAVAAVACIPTWQTDFRDDLPKIDVPVLVLQGSWSSSTAARTPSHGPIAMSARVENGRGSPGRS